MLTDAGHDDDRITEENIDCPDCRGLGGYDASRNCEVYDDWQECRSCGGTGKEVPGDVFVPERDAFTPND
jgi:DnaJ-class molecular chaperone